MINTLVTQVHDNARSKGFYESEKNIGEMLALIHSEVSEALESDRSEVYTNANVKLIAATEDDKTFKSLFMEYIKDTFEDELADICIRVFDLAGYKGIDLENHILAKMRYNSMREHKHGKQY